MYSLRNIILSLTYQDRINGPIEIRIANPGGKTDGHSPAMYWMRARSIPTFGAPFQKVFVLFIQSRMLGGSETCTVHPRLHFGSRLVDHSGTGKSRNSDLFCSV